METLEIHAKDYLVKWVHVRDNCTIDWDVKPAKKLINLAVYKKKDEDGASTPPLQEEDESGPFEPVQVTQSSAPIVQNASPPHLSNSRYRSPSVTSVNKTDINFKTKSRSLTLLLNLTASDLTLVKNYNKLIANELVHGSIEVTHGGMYAFVFDNSFSKTTSKKVLFCTKVVEMENADAHRMSITRRTSVKHDLKNPRFIPDTHIEEDKSTILMPKNGEILQGVLLKRRRKKLQGFGKRFFILNFKYGTLSYFRVDNNKLRGQMPIKHSIISANQKNRELVVDSGMEVWDLKALNAEDFNTWVDAFNQIKKPDELKIEEEPETEVVAELEEILENARLGRDVIQDLERLLARARGEKTEKGTGISRLSFPSLKPDSASVLSGDFYDAEEYNDYDESQVVFLDKGVYELDDEEVVLTNSESTEEQAPSPKLVAHEPAVPNGSADDTLYPLPHGPVRRRTDIPECNHSPSSILAFVRKNVGKDLSTIAMPVDMNEPITFIQKFSEMFEYPEVIENALEGDDPAERILRIASFAVSFLSSVRARERNNRKPFNPLLGETFELVREDSGIRLITEKVCHRPPIFAMFVEGNGWEFTFNPSPDQKFWGKSFEVITSGTAKLTIKATGEVYTWSHPNTLLKNIIAGEKYSEPSSPMTIRSNKGVRAVVEFAKGSMFSGRSEDLTIQAFDSTSKKELPATVTGKWTDSLTLKAGRLEKRIWQAGELLPNEKKKYGFTKFTAGLNEISELEKGFLAPTDSRLRPDMIAYENGKVEEAEQLKLDLEESQRMRRKVFEAKGSEQKPLFFKKVGEEWVYIRGDNSYWNRRSRGDWSGLPKLF